MQFSKQVKNTLNPIDLKPIILLQKFVKVKIEPSGKTIEAAENTPLKDILNPLGFDFPCGGKGKCGGCSLQLLQGRIYTTSEHEKALEKNHLSENQRLACLCTVTEDITIKIDRWETIFLTDNTVFGFEPKTGFGIAVDVGSSTLVAQLINLTTGEVVDVHTSENPQASYGADIITRVEFAVNKNGNTILRKAIRTKIADMISNLLRNRNIKACEILLAGNTVMHHLFCDIDLKPLSYYPFHSQDTGLKTFKAGEIDQRLPSCSAISFLPCIGSFVGSDILSGIIATGISEKEKYNILVDLGTNGEIAVGNKDKIVCASTAAGPAFEGTNISMGMRAVTGAISSFGQTNGKNNYHVIGNTDARGICGSGLIDIIAVFLAGKTIDEGGTLTTASDSVEIAPRVFINQKDVREFQLAKAAIAAGVQILVNNLQISTGDIENVYIAGAFGNFVTIENTLKTGLIEFEPNKIIKAGNTALLGTKMLLYKNNEFINNVLSKTEHISLEAIPAFIDIFTEKMMFCIDG